MSSGAIINLLDLEQFRPYLNTPRLSVGTSRHNHDALSRSWAGDRQHIMKPTAHTPSAILLQAGVEAGNGSSRTPTRRTNTWHALPTPRRRQADLRRGGARVARPRRPLGGLPPGERLTKTRRTGFIGLTGWGREDFRGRPLDGDVLEIPSPESCKSCNPVLLRVRRLVCGG